ncbi:hypothetical protein NPIL_495731 [Nephila pilipes]|uniref:Uncharacterized protein n=1 Tax=Nephila pilipes TaxID=299642 RepID=A0A8X6UI69_NEPPI|nr:hypothetical protein NPIL_495731 [Nephila pilipes]
MSNYCENELIRRLKTSEHRLVIQLDETTDIAGLSILLVIVRYIHGTSAQKDMLIFRSLSTRKTVEGIFNFLNSYFKKHYISQDSYHQVCTKMNSFLLVESAGLVLVPSQPNNVKMKLFSFFENHLNMNLCPPSFSTLCSSVTSSLNFCAFLKSYKEPV